MRYLLYLLLLLPVPGSGQNRIGEWRAHVSFTPVIRVAETSESIVAATVNGIFSVDKKGSQITVKTKAEGLSEVGISALAYASDPNILLIGYESGNVDLLQKGQITNFPDLTRKVDLSDKTIHRIVCEGNFAYLCCTFGIVKIDLLKKEVAETWYLGPNNDLKEAFDLTSFNNSWWVATSRGIFRAEKVNNNLQDYRNWQLQTSLPQAEATYSSFAQSDGLLFTHDTTNDRLLASDGKSWQIRYPEIKKIRGIKTASTGIIVLCTSEIWLTGKTGNSIINNYLSGGSRSGTDPRDALTSSNGDLWIGDYRNGLTRQTGISPFVHLFPNAPGSDQITTLKAGSGAIFAATATSTGGTPEAGISIYQAGIWQNFTSSDDAGLKSIAPITSFAFNKDQTDEYWASTAGSGLLFFQKNRVSAHYNESNSPLGAINGSCIVNGLSTDTQGNLWYTNPTGKVRLGSRSANGAFVSLPYQGMFYSNFRTGDLIETSSAIHWVILPDEGLFAFKIEGSTENISDDQFRKIAVQSRFSNGTTTQISQFGQISSLVADHNNELWVGTGTGVVKYNNPEKVFETGVFYGIQPSPDDGEGLFKPILGKEKITAIAVDGGNRKWFGTANSGVFLFTGEGDHLLHHFDSKNSPLLSDCILSIAIDPLNGEVFFATDRGLIAYKSDATEGVSNLDKAYVWPNPLRETFEGVVTIDGLTDGTDVRITDVAGNLIYTKALLIGWQGQSGMPKTANGVKRVATGVYLIFCSSPQQKTIKNY